MSHLCSSDVEGHCTWGAVGELVEEISVYLGDRLAGECLSGHGPRSEYPLAGVKVQLHILLVSVLLVGGGLCSCCLCVRLCLLVLGAGDEQTGTVVQLNEVDVNLICSTHMEG